MTATADPLVESVLTFDISLVPEDAPDLDATIDKLAALIKIEPRGDPRRPRRGAAGRTKYEPVKIQEEAPWD